LSPYSQAVGMKWLISAVARVMQPGCKADHVLILEGEQGTGKSTALKILGGSWFTDAPFRLGDREGWMVIRGCWLVELGELDSFNRAESTSAKLFFSQYQDRYRSPWGKRPTNVPRQCVFAGTTNQAIYLKDESGNRRYWPVRCGYVDLGELEADRDQLWAEAAELYRQQVPWHVTGDERELFLSEAEARLVPDAYETRIVRFLQDLDPNIPAVTMADILEKALTLEAGRWTRVEQTRVGQVMSRLDWPRMRAGSGRREWYYVRPMRSEGNGKAIDLEATEKRLQKYLTPL
jgi:putative DNA primase/helicase